MRASLITRLGRAAVTLGVALVAACSTDSATAPNLSPAATEQLTASLAANSGEKKVKVGARLSQLSKDTTTEKTIGVQGGTVGIPHLGFELVVPPGAVTTPTKFKVKALQGRAVAYEFSPHGATFAVPLRFRQDARYTSVGWGQAVSGGYFTDPRKIDSRGKKASVAEEMPARWNGVWIEFDIRHFSGYLVSCA